MYRFIGLASILIVSALQMGCCSSPCGKGMGCGRTYWGAYYDDPPTCEPCDNCGNFTGGNRNSCKKDCGNNCENSCDFNWKRGSRVSLLSGLFNTDMFDCLKLSCSEPSCGEPACGEPSCGEPGCGSGSTYGGNAGTSYESSVPMTSSRSPMRVSNVSYQANNWSNAKPCNCGKQH